MTKIGLYDLDIWSVIHFVYYGGFGYYYPNHFVFVMCGGVGWELFEQMLGESRPGWLGGFDKGNINIKDCPNWLYGRKSDILMNVTGFFYRIYANFLINYIYTKLYKYIILSHHMHQLHGQKDQ